MTTLRITTVVGQLDFVAAGPSYTVPRLAAALAARGNEVSLHTLHTKNELRFPSVDVHTYPALDFVPLIGFAPTMLGGLREAASRSDVVHNHNLWMAPNVLASVACWRRPAKLVISPRGVFAAAALAISTRKKMVMWALAQGRAVRAADCLHATSNAEADDIRRMGLRAPVAIVPNGINLPLAQSARAPTPASGRRRLLYLGRLHRIKGVHRLLSAWSSLEPQFPTWDLSIVGPSERGFGDELQATAKSLGLRRVRFSDAKYGADKWAEYAASDLYVLPTDTENFGITVAEALASEVPTIVTKGAPWAAIEVEQCGSWIDHGVGPLRDALARTMSLDDATRRTMGARGRAWMKRDFDWGGIAEKVEATYRWVLHGGVRPGWVHTA